MATVTLGTTSTSALTAIPWNPMSPIADIASIAEAIKSQNPIARIIPQVFSNNGRLQFPNHRGFILLNPGDYIAVDSRGWPIVVSSQSIAAGGTSWAHT